MPKVTQQASGEACAGEREGREGVLGQWLEEGEVHIFYVTIWDKGQKCAGKCVTASKCLTTGSPRKVTLALSGMAQWIECQPVIQKVAGLIPSQGTCLGCRSL